MAKRLSPREKMLVAVFGTTEPTREQLEAAQETLYEEQIKRSAGNNIQESVDRSMMFAGWCDALMEQMKKEKENGQAAGCIFGNTPSENTCRFCGVNCGVRVSGANGVSKTELVPSGETVGLSIMAYLDKNVKHDNGSVCGVRLDVAREWIREKINPKQKLSDVDLDKLVNEEFASRSQITEYGPKVIYNRAELSRFIKRMALLFNVRKEE